MIVGFLTPDWDDSWGGELQIEDKTIKFKPGNFVLFSGNNLHDAMPVKVGLPTGEYLLEYLLNKGEK